jgi:hypothetical protein
MWATMIWLRLQKDDEFTAASIAFRRAFESPDKVDRSIEKLNLHESIARDAEAIGAEMIVAQYFGIKNFEPTVGGFKLHADIGGNVEVKWTRYKDGHLLLSDRDRDSDIAILVTGKSPVYYLAGWIPIKAAKRPTRKRSDGAYWINQSDLNPMSDLARSMYAIH